MIAWIQEAHHHDKILYNYCNTATIMASSTQCFQVGCQCANTNTNKQCIVPNLPNYIVALHFANLQDPRDQY